MAGGRSRKVAGRRAGSGDHDDKPTKLTGGTQPAAKTKRKRTGKPAAKYSDNAAKNVTSKRVSSRLLAASGSPKSRMLTAAASDGGPPKKRAKRRQQPAGTGSHSLRVTETAEGQRVSAVVKPRLTDIKQEPVDSGDWVPVDSVKREPVDSVKQEPVDSVKQEPAECCRAPFPATGGLYIGAHVSGAGGLWHAVREAHSIGARSFALFLGSQRTWTRKPLSQADAAQFRAAMQEYGYSGDLVVPHGSYLMNLGSPDPETRSKSCQMLVDELRRCQMLGLPLFNLHPGSTCGKISREECIGHIAEGISAALLVTSGVTVLLENMSKQGNTLGGDFSELRAIIDRVEDPGRVGVCLDTCHAHAAGYDLSAEDGFSAMMSEFDLAVGLRYLRAVHVNDSKGAAGSHLDRHENIGRGTIGRAGLARALADPRLRRLPLVLETPCTSDDTYRREIKLLYGMVTA